MDLRTRVLIETRSTVYVILLAQLSLISFERLALLLTGCERFSCHRHLCDREPCGCIATAGLSLGSLVHLAMS